MKLFKKTISALAVTAMCVSPNFANAAGCEMTGGTCYEECRRAPYCAPAVALGTLALVAIIAVAIHNSDDDHSHAHTHS